MRIKTYAESQRWEDTGDVAERTNHSNEKAWLLCGSSHTCITNNANSKTSGETCETDRKTSTEIDETGRERHLCTDYRDAGQLT